MLMLSNMNILEKRMNLEIQYKSFNSSDDKVHLDIISQSKDGWKLIDEVLESKDRIILIFSKVIGEQ